MDDLDLQVVERFRDHDLAPIRQLIDISVDETVTIITLADGTEVRIQLKGIEDRRDSVHGALTDSRVRLLVDDDNEDWCTVGTYHPPQLWPGPDRSPDHGQLCDRWPTGCLGAREARVAPGLAG